MVYTMLMDITPGDCTNCDPTTRYDRVSTDVIGAGTYGEVYKVRCRKTGKIFALKRMKLMDAEDGVPSTAIREVSILKELPHKNIVKLHDIFCAPNKMSLIFELIDFDLKKFMKSNHVGPAGLTLDIVQDFAHQLLTGLEFCHRNRIIHRDLKPQNLLVKVEGGNKNYTLKIADFGLARVFSLPIPRLTHEVVTVWYRAPEILLGCEKYCIGVDMWSVGCIIAELGCGTPLFMGECELSTLFKIFRKCGTPDERLWPGVSTFPSFCTEFPKWKKIAWEKIRELGRSIGAAGCDMLTNIMAYPPQKRASCRGTLTHEFFREYRIKNKLAVPFTPRTGTTH
eukprot:GEMP01006379.1.p1 GENE.GEMP01006379.1~~GEMP01006379.1.p1  ORF type:complete len:339 (+),score=49.84 GEMP01006379.1:103-1119(+)